MGEGRAPERPGPDAPRLEELFPEAAALHRALRSRGWTVAVAESCTGGLLGAALTAAPGSSDVVVGGVVVYSNRLKTDLLGVDPALVAGHGAVSEVVARAMAEATRRRCGADVGLAVTGVAGPGASEAKPAGLVHLAAAVPGRTAVARLDTDLGREGNRVAAVRAVLGLAVRVVRG